MKYCDNIRNFNAHGILEQSTFLHIVLDFQFNILAINDTALQLYGFTSKNIIGKHFFQLCREKLIHSHLLEKHLTSLNKNTSLIESIPFPDGKIKTILWDLKEVNEASSFINLFGADFTYLSLIEKDKNNLSIYLENIINNVPHYIFWKDLNSVFMGCNKAFAYSAGLSSPKNIIGKTDYELPWGKYEADNYRQDDQDVMYSGKSKLNIEESQTTPTGEMRTILTSKVPLFDEKGMMFGVLGIYTDITAIKNTELALKEAISKTEAASKAKTEFIANMSHDIRTPITGILGLAQSFYDNATTIEGRTDAKTLINATHELLNLLNGIIDVAGLESGQLKVKKEDFSLRSLIDHNIDLLKPVVKHKKLDLHLNIDHSVPDHLYANCRYLDRILLNLLSNAVKFTDKGSVSLSVSVQPKKDEQLILKLIISDTGIGIPKDKLKQIFQHFSRLNPSARGIYKGSGLGLYTVKQYLREMRGSIRVESEPNKGSSFIVTIPCTISSNELPSIKKSDNLPSTSSKFQGSKDTVNASILVVDDSALAARMVQQTLLKLNCKVDIASNGEEAVSAVTQYDYDLVFMDIGLPDIDGFTATQRIRQLEDTFKAHVPIIALTAHIAEQMRQQCVEVGMQEMLTKPITLELMERTLEKYLTMSSFTEKISTLPIEATHSLETIDLKHGANLGGGDLHFAKKMMTMLAESLPGDLIKITTAHQQKNLPQLEKLIHKLYGGLCYCGVPKLRDISKNLQEALKTHQSSQIDTLVEQLEHEGKAVLKTWETMEQSA